MMQNNNNKQQPITPSFTFGFDSSLDPISSIKMEVSRARYNHAGNGDNDAGNEDEYSYGIE